ncbi:RNase adapter RapZ [Saccharibacter sp. 17.LH.SD]|uniref:RNase adapter RapZ n=1 Tax=Saccharibacter sp. 17.LH.SD TaxID=2689393 RepID=UPI00136C8713|nr:RNase adapter RapZ [Saccharibacter sp. 17.LH.SD]MXV43750.1 RNase adapter RapZ [Saccharibacter sp. 17.LH.SD]
MTDHHSRRIVVVTGLSGAGKSSILKMLEDLDYEVVDNPPLDLLDALTGSAGKRLAIGIDVRSRGFEAHRVLERLSRLRALPHCAVQLLYATAENDVILRRFTATRRRHPLVSGGSVLTGIEQEADLLEPLRADADLVIDTSDLPVPELRRLITARFGEGAGSDLSVVLMSFAYPAGLPREADIVLDARFLRNPHYDETLRPRTGLEADVAHYVQEDPFYAPFYQHVLGLIRVVLPRFIAEGKKYVTIAIGCSGGRHRSVTIVEALARDLALFENDIGETHVPVMVLHRELARQGLASWRWAIPPETGNA